MRKWILLIAVISLGISGLVQADGDGLPLFYVPVVMRVYRTYSPCLEEGGA